VRCVTPGDRFCYIALFAAYHARAVAWKVFGPGRYGFLSGRTGCGCRGAVLFREQ
jgi:hypothetical protein